MSKTPFHKYAEEHVSPFWHDCPALVPGGGRLTPIASAVVDPDGPVLFDSIRVDTRYLGTDVETDGSRLHDANLVFVKAPKGTGKTTWTEEYLKSIPQERSVLQIGHRKSLATVLSNALGLECYLEDKAMHWRYSVSMDSLRLIKSAPAYDVLIIDESEQVFRHMIGDTTKGNREEIFNLLVKLCWNAKQVICLDADMTSELTGYVMSKLRRNFESDRILTIVNEWQTDRAIEMYEDKHHLIAELIAAIIDGKRVYVPVSELTLANTLKSLLSQLVGPDGKPIEVLLLTGETNDEDRHKAFFADPNGEAQKYQVLIATSTLSTGVSIDVDWFDAVYGIFGKYIYSYQDCDQAISRVRKCDTVKVWIQSGGMRPFPSEHAIRNGAEEKEVTTRRFILPDEDASLTRAESKYLDVHARITWCAQEWKIKRDAKFYRLKEDEGWQVLLVPVDAERKKAGAEMLKFGRDPMGNKKAKLIFEAENLPADEAESLSEKDSSELSVGQKRSLKKWAIAKFFRLPSPEHLTLRQIQQYETPEVRDVVKNARLLQASRTSAMQLDRYERESEEVTRAFTDYDHRVVKRDLFSGALQESGIDLPEAFRRAADYKTVEEEYEAIRATIRDSNSRPARDASKHRREQLAKLEWIVTDEAIDRVARYAAKHLSTVNLFLGTKFKSPEAPETKVKVFNTLLGRLGLAIKKNRKTGSQGYVIDYERVAELSVVVNENELLAA